MAVGFPTKANWASGDILTAAQMDDLAGTVNYLSPVGQTNGSTLVSNSANASGLGWTSGNPIPNPVLNSCLDIWQRGTSIALAASTSYTAGFSADRWQTGTGVNQAVTISRQATGDTTNLPNIQYAARYQRNSGQTGTGNLVLAQSFESANSVPFAGKQVTFSFYARAGANYSATSNALIYQLYTGTGTDQNIFSGAYTGAVAAINSTATLTTTWQRFTGTATLATNTNELAIQFIFVPTGTAGVNDYFEVTGVQIDQGSVALPIRRNATTLQGELAACQRYYFRRTGTTSPVILVPSAGAFSTTIAMGYVQPPVPMRTTPTSIDTSNIAFLNYAENSFNLSSFTLSSRSTESVIYCYGTTTGLTANQGGTYQNNSAGGYIGFSAEL